MGGRNRETWWKLFEPLGRLVSIVYSDLELLTSEGLKIGFHQVFPLMIKRLKRNVSHPNLTHKIER